MRCSLTRSDRERTRCYKLIGFSEEDVIPEGARYQAVKPLHQRVEDNVFYLRADESRWIGFSEEDIK